MASSGAGGVPINTVDKGRKKTLKKTKSLVNRWLARARSNLEDICSDNSARNWVVKVVMRGQCWATCSVNRIIHEGFCDHLSP